jgi:phospholipid/cholesterol/gamma-HCH transport system substrate-binding protein
MQLIKFSKYAKLGILMVFSISVLIWGLNYLKGNDIFIKSKIYHVIYERIDGLSESNEIVLNGYKIGQVKEIKFLSDNSMRLLVSFMIEKNVKIPVNSVAQIVTSDLMGTRSIQLILSDNQEFYQSNDTIPGTIESDLKEQVSQQVLPIKNKAEELLGTIDSAITILTVIFNEDARKNLSESFKNINQTIINIERATADLQEIVGSEKENIKSIISNIDSISYVFNKNTLNMENTLKNLSDFSDSLAQISITPVLNNFINISSQVNDVLAKLEGTESTAGLLLNDDDLYNSVKTLSTDINLLINDIRIHPERYVQFSAIDLGKNVYINTSGELDEENIVFKIHLISSKDRIPPDSEFFEDIDQVEEYKTGRVYNYLTGESNSYVEIADLFQKVSVKFPKATIVAFKNGRIIKLEKALRHLK